MQDFGYDDKYDKDKQGDKMQDLGFASPGDSSISNNIEFKEFDTNHGNIIPLTVSQELNFLASKLIEKAETFGYEVVIETVPLQPLKMGNKKHKVTITPKNKR